MTHMSIAHECICFVKVVVTVCDRWIYVLHCAVCQPIQRVLPFHETHNKLNWLIDGLISEAGAEV